MNRREIRYLLRKGKIKPKKKYNKITVEMLEKFLLQIFSRKPEGEQEKSLDYYFPREVWPGMWKIGPVFTNGAGLEKYHQTLKEQLRKRNL